MQLAADSFLVMVKPLWSSGSCPLEGWWQSRQFTPAACCAGSSRYSCTTAEVSWRWQSAHLPVAATRAGVVRLTSTLGRFDWIRKAETIIAVLSTTAMKTPRNDMALSLKQWSESSLKHAQTGRPNEPESARIRQDWT